MSRNSVPNYTSNEFEVAEDRDYLDYDPRDVFMVSGYLTWLIDEPGPKPRVLSSRVFNSVPEARMWAIQTYGRVYRDMSYPDLGVWRFVVPRVLHE